MARLEEADVRIIYEKLANLFQETFLPHLREEARRIAEQEVKRLIYSDMTDEIRSRIRECVRAHVNVEAIVSLK